MENRDEAKYIAIGKRIEHARRQDGLTQSELAVKLKYQSPTAVSLIEAGKRMIKAAELERIATALHTTVDYLLSGSAKSSGVSVKMALRAEHKDLSPDELGQIESFIEFVKTQKSGRDSNKDQ